MPDTRHVRHVAQAKTVEGPVWAIFVNDEPRWAFASRVAAEEALDLPTEECVALQLAANAKAEAQEVGFGRSSAAECRARKAAVEARKG